MIYEYVGETIYLRGMKNLADSNGTRNNLQEQVYSMSPDVAHFQTKRHLNSKISYCYINLGFRESVLQARLRH